jgi:hypothetical protein
MYTITIIVIIISIIYLLAFIYQPLLTSCINLFYHFLQ